MPAGGALPGVRRWQPPPCRPAVGHGVSEPFFSDKYAANAMPERSSSSLLHSTPYVGTRHHVGSSACTSARPKRSSISTTTPRSLSVRITRPAACTTLRRPSSTARQRREPEPPGLCRPHPPRQGQCVDRLGVWRRGAPGPAGQGAQGVSTRPACGTRPWARDPRAISRASSPLAPFSPSRPHPAFWRGVFLCLLRGTKLLDS